MAALIFVATSRLNPIIAFGAPCCQTMTKTQAKQLVASKSPFAHARVPLLLRRAAEAACPSASGYDQGYMSPDLFLRWRASMNT
jgi:hypothetical protein